jgi:hypothetical protein
VILSEQLAGLEFPATPPPRQDGIFDKQQGIKKPEVQDRSVQSGHIGGVVVFQNSVADLSTENVKIKQSCND